MFGKSLVTEMCSECIIQSPYHLKDSFFGGSGPYAVRTRPLEIDDVFMVDQRA